MKMQDQVIFFDKDRKPGARFYTARLRRRKQEAKRIWLQGVCIVCAETFGHLSNYKPATCGRFDCLRAFQHDPQFAEARKKHGEYMARQGGWQ